MVPRLYHLVLTLALLVSFVVTSPVLAGDVTLPVPIQIELLAKIATYDDNMRARAVDKVHVLIVTKPGNDESAQAATQAEKAFAARPSIVGLPHDEATLAFGDAKGLAQACRARRASIVYLTPGFTDADLRSVATALEGVDVLTAGAVRSFVRQGIVVGFDLVGGKPKLLVHLGQARKQNVKLTAQFLNLVEVVEK